MSKITHHPWNKQSSDRIHLFRMENASGAFINLSNYGATLVAAYVPDRKGLLGNVILGFPDLQGYLCDKNYVGATIGRFANRISGAKFVLDGNSYTLNANDGENNIHSGNAGFNARVFDFDIDQQTLSFSLFSEDGEGGFPGNLEFKVSYRWTDDNELLIDYWASSDQNTIANFTNHAYFNLAAATTKIFDHELTIHSDHLVDAGPDHIPSGLIVPAAELSFKKNKISEKMTINDAGEVSGLNVCYVLAEGEWTKAPACILTSPQSGRVMEVYTSYPGLMLYTGDYLESSEIGNHGKVYAPFDGLCLECQYFPDSPNQSLFPSTVLTPEAVYQHSIHFKFRTIA